MLHHRAEYQRRSLLNSLNSTYIGWKYQVPLLHFIISLLEIAAMSLLIQKFNSAYAKRPLLTTMITNAVLGAVADTTAQVITSVREKAARQPGGPTKDDFLAIEIHELDRKMPWPPGELIPVSDKLPPPFDFERMTRFMAYPFIMAPVQLRWFKFLSSAFPMGEKAGLAVPLKRMACDQLIFSPAGLACFFTFMTVAEGGGVKAIKKKFSDVYLPALKANWVLWPAVQIVNFRFMPLQFQIPFVSAVGIAWTAYLSLTNASEGAADD